MKLVGLQPNGRYSGMDRGTKYGTKTFRSALRGKMTNVIK